MLGDMRTSITLILAIAVSVSVGSTANAACNIVNGVAYGNCAGVTVNTKQTPFQVIKSYGSLTGISEGAHVLAGGSLSVSGIADRVIVDRGGSARISGILHRLVVSGSASVTGQVGTILLRDGGRVTIDGIVGDISGNGTALLNIGAVISGHPTEKTHEVAF